MKRHAGIKKARLLIELAKCSVGTKQAIDAHKLHLNNYLKNMILPQPNLKTIEQEVN